MEMRRLSEPLALARTIKQLNVQNSDSIKLARLLVSETTRKKNFIDAFINKAVKPSGLNEFNLGVQAFLRLFVFETRIASNWSQVDVKSAEGITSLARSILGWKTIQPVEPFLGSLLTQRPSIVFEQKNDEARIALETFHPVWFVEYCFRLFGRQQALAILEADMSPPPPCIRLNTLKGEPDETLAKLREEGIEVEKTEESKFTYKIVRSRTSVTKTACFHAGSIQLQDKSDSFAVEAANPGPGMTVLDACCAPGTNTAQLGQLMNNEGLIISVDYSRRRMMMWASEVQRNGVEIAESVIADVCRSLPLNMEADVVILDPPCTGTGLFSRLPSLKWRLSPNSIGRMVDIQFQMLNNCAGYLKSMGTLIYSTSSITVEENEMLIERFLKWHSEFSLAEISPRIGLPGLRGLEKCQRLYPHVHNCNGLFVAKLIKEKNHDE